MPEKEVVFDAAGVRSLRGSVMLMRKLLLLVVVVVVVCVYIYIYTYIYIYIYYARMYDNIMYHNIIQDHM